ncbi:MucBP domain-containing protein [Vagococcus carniphilus]|uniref:MucBP domain-containing protein n=1 Tax=Vagococcus carniphilus TaxID=218144 RepID=UPI003BAD6DE5
MKKQSLLKKIGAILLLGSLFAVGTKVSAVDPGYTAVSQMPGINIIDSKTKLPTAGGNIIPEEFAKVLRVSDEMSYSSVGTSKIDKAYVEFDRPAAYANPNAQRYVQINKIGVFQGRFFDLRIHVDKVTPAPGKKEKGTVRIYTPTTKSEDFLFVWTRLAYEGATTTIRYEFLDSATKRPIDYQGMWNFRRINTWKSIELTNSDDYLHGTYAYNVNKLQYKTDYAKETMLITGDKNGTSEALDSYFTTLFKTEDGSYTHKYELTDGSQARVRYDSQPITKTEMPTPELMGHVHEDYPNISYTAYQDVPEQAMDTFYPNGFILNLKFDEAVDMDSVDVDIKQVQDPSFNASKYFTVLPDKSNNMVRIMLSNAAYKDSNFIDSSYRFDVDASVKDKQNLSKYYKDGYYHIPAKAYYSTSEKPSSIVQTADSLTKAVIQATPITQHAVKGTDTSKWKDKSVSDLFKDTYGAYDGDDLVIDSIENKSFSSVGDTKVSVTLKGSKSGLKRTFEVPVKVTEVKSAFIHFTDETGKEISKTIEKNGAEGEQYDFNDSIKEIPNYTFSKVNETKGSPIKGVFPTSKEINIYVEYKMNDQLVTVNHVDEDGNPIAKATAEKYAPNSDHTLGSVVVPGYQVASVKVDGQGKTLSEDGKVNVSVKDKPVTVDFTYKAVQFSLSLDSDKKLVSANDTIDYTLDVKSGMKYPVGTESGTYKNVSITIPVDSKIKSISDITVVDSENAVIGTGEYNDGKITVTLTETVKDTDSFKVNYTATVKGDAPSGQIIETKATMKASYDVNGATREVVKNSNKVDVSIKDSATKTVAIHYIDEKGKKIIDPAEMPGLELQAYDFSNEIKTIPGYKFVKVDETKGLPIKGILPAGNAKENIYVVYELAELKVTTNHVDEKGKSIAKESTQELLSGSDYTIKSVSVPGYKVKSVQVDGKDVPLTSEGNVVISVKDKEIAVKFTYESIHFTMKLSSDKLGVSPRGAIDYTLEVKSGMTYPEGTEAADYEGLEIAIPIDSKIDEVSKIKVVNGKNEVIGEGTFSGGKLNVKLTKTVKSTETIKVTYTATVKNDVQEGQSIETEATMKATYSVNGEDLVITNKSNKVNVTVTDAATKAVKIHYVDDKGKEIHDPTLKTGAELQDYDYSDEIITIPGYKYVKVDEEKGLPIKGTFSAGNKAEDIYVVYEQDEFAVTTKFVDEKGQAIAAETVKKYIAGKEYTIPSVSVPGYKIKSVKVDGVDKPLSEGSKVVVSIKDKPVAVTFAYESVQYSLKLSVDKATVSQKDKLTYTLDVKSGMVYPEGTSADNYTNVKIEVPIDSRLTNVSDIKILNSKGDSVGIGQFDTDSGKLKVSLTESVKNTEDLKLSYTAEVKEDAKTDEVIEAKATMTASFQVNGESREISRESNKVNSTIAGGLVISSRPETIDFGEVSYKAKDFTVDNPSVSDSLEVTDTRSDKTDGWSLTAKVVTPLNDNGKVLDGNMVYRKAGKDLDINSTQVIYSNQDQSKTKVDVTETWGNTADSDGVKLKFKYTDKMKKGSYTGVIRWTLMAGQP